MQELQGSGSCLRSCPANLVRARGFWVRDTGPREEANETDSSNSCLWVAYRRSQVIRTGTI